MYLFVGISWTLLPTTLIAPPSASDSISSSVRPRSVLVIVLVHIPIVSSTDPCLEIMKISASMPSIPLLLLVLAAIASNCCGAYSTNHARSSNRVQGKMQQHTIASRDRRALLNGMLVSVTGSVAGFSSLKPSPAAAATLGAEKFVGKYSDPINHPGGTRSIKLVDGAIVGDYQLAQVFGGGGRGEPQEYVLPAVVVGNRAIIIDFSPKGGPRDFSGVLESDGSIKFIRDGNRWPRLE
ncbi:hypothetical protein ACHAWF_003501 [Thalassiosira exigua]